MIEWTSSAPPHIKMPACALFVLRTEPSCLPGAPLFHCIVPAYSTSVNYEVRIDDRWSGEGNRPFRVLVSEKPGTATLHRWINPPRYELSPGSRRLFERHTNVDMALIQCLDLFGCRKRNRKVNAMEGTLQVPYAHRAGCGLVRVYGLRATE